MVENELAEDEEIHRVDLHTAEGANDPQGEGGDVEDMVGEKADKGNLITNLDDDEGFEGGRLMQAKSKLKLKLLSLLLWLMFQWSEFRRVVSGGFLQKNWLF